MDIESCYKIGYVAKTHGLKGEVTIIFDRDAPPPGELTLLWIEFNSSLVPYSIENYSDRGDKTFIKLEDISTQEQAAQLKGCSLYLPKDVRTKLDRGEFYDDEVTGFEVIDLKSGSLGLVREVLQMGPNRLLAINGTSGEILIPVNGPFIQNINRFKKKFTVDLPDGFLEI